jgi:hypothetical protein
MKITKEETGWYVYVKPGTVARFDTEGEARWYANYSSTGADVADRERALNYVRPQPERTGPF